MDMSSRVQDTHDQGIDSTVPTVQRPPFVRWGMRFSGVFILPVLFLAWSLLSYGSVAIGWAALRGDRVSLVPHTLDLGWVKAGETTHASLIVWNLTNHELSLIGGRTSCGCLQIDGLPVKIRAGRSQRVPISLTAGVQQSGANRQGLDLLTGELGTPQVHAEVRYFVQGVGSNASTGSSQP